MTDSQFSIFDAGEASDDDPSIAGAGTARPGARPETAVSVSDVNEAVSTLLDRSFTPLWVRGEIANWRPHRSGNRWFSLRDDSAQLPCVIWKSDLARLPAEPEDGMSVTAFGSLGLYQRRGEFRFVVRRIEAEGEGLWRLAFERLRRSLAAEGLLDPARKHTLPRVPATVGVVTSKSGAALRDVLAVIRRRAPWTRVLISDCRVQGEGASKEIQAALERLVAEGSSEVIVLTRGGGSIEDLWEFNDESLARAIAACPIPTVSAVGHEIDVTMADLVADVRAPTPSAAGEAVTEDEATLRAELELLSNALISALRGRTQREADRLRRNLEALVRGWERRSAERRAQLAVLAGRLDGLSPIGVLSRGFGVALDADGRVLRSARAFAPGLPFVLRLADGSVQATTDDVDLADTIPQLERGAGQR